jgi:cathepsin A (carboxypeptidase C)
MGLLFELGPCQIASDDGSVARNKYSWNTHSNILFLDQPVNVGWSYSDDGSKVSRSYAAGEDVYAFFQLFFSRFPEYATAKFHMAAESYGGTYAPNTAAVFDRKNRELEVDPVPRLTKINLASVILANGWTNPLEQYPSIPDWLCEGPYALFEPESRECKGLRRSVPRCRSLTEACQKFDNSITCASAESYCSYALESLVPSTSSYYLVRFPGC